MVRAAHVEEQVKAFRAKAEGLVQPVLAEETLAGILATDSNVLESREVIERLHKASKGSIPADLLEARVFPRVSLRPTFAESEISSVLVTISSLRDAAFPFKYKRRFGADQDLELIARFIRDSYEDLIRHTYEYLAVTRINEVYSAAVEAADVPYTVTFVTSAEARPKTPIVSITDSELVLAVDRAGLFGEIVNDALIFLDYPEENEAGQAAQKAAVESLVKTLSGAQSVVDYLKLKEAYANALTDFQYSHISTKIVQAFSKNALNNFGNKADGVQYYNVDGVFAGLQRTDGDYEVTFGPLDLKTLEASDLDVVAELEAARGAVAA